MFVSISLKHKSLVSVHKSLLTTDRAEPHKAMREEPQFSYLRVSHKSHELNKPQILTKWVNSMMLRQYLVPTSIYNTQTWQA